MALNASSSKAQIGALQAALNKAGAYPALVVDRVLGPKTMNAVRQWQRAAGIRISYETYVDDATLDALSRATGVDIRGGNAPSPFPGYPVPGANLPGGGSNTGGRPAPVTSARVNFEWKCPAKLSLTSGAWAGVQNALTNAARSAGFEIQYASWETTPLSAYLYTLVYRGLSPANETTADAINNHMCRLAEQAGFTVARDSASVSLGQIVATTGGDGGAPNKTNQFVVVGAVLLVAVVAVSFFFDD